ncbi:MAG TPA: cation:proton antiporter [Candidatus Thermoplasmatota archaeon]|jgi:CPA2 family monovalent cation:H+ antiporter-2|nr:cation:proton antiporter [Candidatus Thermoplasmatota archaeon]
MEPIHQLALAFGAAVLAGLAARRLGQSVVPAYVLAGMALGPAGLALVVDRTLLQPLSVLGLVLLLFFMGLESSSASLASAPRRTVKDGALDFGLNFTPAFVIGLAFGWDAVLASFLGLACYATSSGIAVKAIIELRRTANADTGVVMNLMVVEDLVTAILLAGLSSVAFTGSTDPAIIAFSALKAFVVVLAFLFLARPLVQRLGHRNAANRPHHARSQELFLLSLLAVVLAAAALAEGAGLSAALGAFLLGLALADSVHGPRLREAVVPLRDACVAAFFFAFGMLVDLGNLGAVWPMLLVLVPVTLVTKFATGLLIASRRGQTAKARFNIATTLLARGEFSIVVADTAAAAGLGAALSTVAGMYVVITAIIGSVLMAATGRLVAAAQVRSHFQGSFPKRMRLAARRRAHALRTLAGLAVPGLRGELGKMS